MRQLEVRASGANGRSLPHAATRRAYAALSSLTIFLIVRLSVFQAVGVAADASYPTSNAPADSPVLVTLREVGFVLGNSVGSDGGVFVDCSRPI